MTAHLLDARYVPAGFEMVLPEGDIAETGRFWNLWFNTTLSDDPARWDDEVRKVNALQSRLDGLPDEHRLIRAQMAALCRVNPFFPLSVDRLCGEIGAGRYEPVRLGCEGRGLLEMLGHEPPERLAAQRAQLLACYRKAMAAWAGGGTPADAWQSKVWGDLGAPDAAKRRHVGRLLAAVDPAEPTVQALRETAQAICRETRGAAALETPGRPWRCFSCGVNADAVPLCGCTYGLFVDAALLCIGATDGRDPAEAPARYVQETVLAYCLALNTWLHGAPPRPGSDLIDPRYIGGDLATRLAEGVHATLGAGDPAQVWLVACLLKTLKSNQRWYPHSELVDAYPEATSWLGG